MDEIPNFKYAFAFIAFSMSLIFLGVWLENRNPHEKHTYIMIKGQKCILDLDSNGRIIGSKCTEATAGIGEEAKFVTH